MRRKVARKHSEAAIATLSAISKDKGEPAAARIRAATRLLNRGYGRPRQSLERPTPPPEISAFTTQDEINAEIRRRGLLPVLELVAEEMERGRRGTGRDRREAANPPHSRNRGGAAPPPKREKT